MWEKKRRKNFKRKLTNCIVGFLITYRLLTHLWKFHIKTKNHITGKAIKTQKLLIQVPNRELHNNLIKYPPEGDFYGTRSESGDVIIGDSSLRRYMTPRVKNSSNSHRLTDGCEIFISESIMTSELNEWISRKIEKLISVSEISH